MNFISEIDLTRFDDFVYKHHYSHYMKTSSWANYKHNCEKIIPHYVGLEENGNLIATALLLQKKTHFINYFYIPWGMCCDYENEKLTRYFLNNIKSYVHQYECDFLRIDLNVERIHHDLLGNPLNDNFSNEFVTNYFIDEKFKHKGYGYAYNGSWVNRFTLIIDISRPMNEIIESFDKRKQLYLRSMPEQGITTRVGTHDDLKYVALFEEHLSEIQGFKPKPVSYFEKLIDYLQDNAVIYVTEMDTTKYLDFIEKSLETKKVKADKTATTHKLKEYSEALNWKEKYGNKIVLASGIFARLDTKAWDLYIYSNKLFPMIHASDSFHAFAIEDMKNHGVLSYDMVGFSGVTKPTDPYYGLYKYKSSFNPRFVEYIGEFDYIFNDKKYQNYLKITRLLNRIRRKCNSVRYKNKTHKK